MNNEELKALAQRHVDLIDAGDMDAELEARDAFEFAARSDVVLGLIADMDRLNEDRERIRSQRMEYASKYEQAIEDCDRLKAENEALRNGCSELRSLFVDATEQCCKAERERDALKAELATERQRRWDGNESSSSEHAEEIRALKAECEGLRKDAERYRWLKTKHQDTGSDIGVYDGAQILRTNAEVYDLHLDLSVDHLMSKEASNG